MAVESCGGNIDVLLRVVPATGELAWPMIALLHIAVPVVMLSLASTHVAQLCNLYWVPIGICPHTAEWDIVKNIVFYPHGQFV